MTGLAVYSAVNAVSRDLSHEGISKSRQTVGGATFKFRGIDQVMNALAPLLVANRLIIVPRILERQCEERTMRSGAVMFYVTVAAEFDFISAEDGSKFTARTYGEAMDSGDKATNKAMAIAYKYAAFQTFCIPTEGSGDTDADATVHEPVVAKPRPAPPRNAEPARGGYGPQKNNVDRIEQPIDEIPHTQPKEATTEPASSTEDNAPVAAAASVPAARLRKTAADIPTVAPGGSRTTDWKAAEREKLARREARDKHGQEIKANYSTEVRGNLKFHLDAIKPEAIDARKHLKDWLGKCSAAKRNLTDDDQLGLTGDYNLKLAVVGKAERMRVEAFPPRTEDDGDFREAAE